MDTQTQIDRLIELAIIQRSELKQLVEQLPQLREHLNAEVEKVFDETEPQLRAELEEWTTKQTADKTAALGVALETKIADLAKSLEVSTQARYNAIIAEREENARLAAQAEAKIAEHAASLPGAVKEIVSAELARFPRAGEIEQLRKEFAEPRGLNPRGKWLPTETYNKLDLVTWNGDSYVSNIDGNKERPARNSSMWTLSAARGIGGGGPSDLSALTAVPSNGSLLIGSGTSWVNGNLVAGDGITITNGAGSISIAANGGVNYQGTWNASTNTPTLTSSVGTKGFYYVVSVAGTTNLNGVTDWQVGDWAIFNGIAWEKVDTTDQVSSVFGRTGAVSAVSTDYSTVGITNTAIGASNPSTGAFTTLTTTGTITPSGSVHAANGSAANPSLAFVNSQSTGLYRYGAGAIGIAAGGTSVGNWDATALNITNTTDSSSKDTGAIVTEGGLGVEKSATIGGNLTVSGTGNVTGQLIGFANAANTTNFGSLVAANATLNAVTSYSASASTDQKYWAWQAGTAVGDGTFRLRALNDTATNGINALTFTRSGISSIAATLNGNLTVSGGTSANTNIAALRSNYTGGASAPYVSLFGFSDDTTGARIVGDVNGAADIGAGLKIQTRTNAGVLQDVISFPKNTNNTTLAGNLTVSGGTVTSGTGTLTLNSSANTVVLQSAGTTALTLDSSQNATFAKNVTASGGTALFQATNANSIVHIKVNSDTYNPYIRLEGYDRSIYVGVKDAGADGTFNISTAAALTSPMLSLDPATNGATFAGAIAIGNTVQTAAAVASTHKVTISIGGVTYYLLATNV